MPDTQEHIIINGKYYPMWEQFVQRKEEWIGGILLDQDNDPIFGPSNCAPTQIKDIVLKENGTNSAFFEVVGADYSCGFDVTVGGISGKQPDPKALRLQGYGSMAFSITRKDDAPTSHA